jgi:hypothetical protein
MTKGSLALTAVLFTAALVSPLTSEARSFLPCGTAPHFGVFDDYDPGTLRYLVKPRNCTYSTNGTEAGTIRLERLNWKRWGGKRAFARGVVTDNHDQDNNGFQRRPVKIILGNRLRAFPAHLYRRSKKRYYTKMIVIRLETGTRGVIPLYRPGEPLYRND